MTQIKTREAIVKIMQIIEEYKSCPGEINLLKTACEAYQISIDDAERYITEDIEIADNMRDYWTHLRCRAEK